MSQLRYSQPPSREVDLDPGLLIAAAQTEYKLKVRWYTRRDEDNCFARWGRRGGGNSDRLSRYAPRAAGGYGGDLLPFSGRDDHLGPDPVIADLP
jgi:hypothetical protein